jgi:ferredoxin
MKLVIDDDSCRGHGVCVAICPDVFTLTDAGYAEVSVDTVPPEYEDLAAEAVAACPEQAIAELPTKE